MSAKHILLAMAAASLAASEAYTAAAEELEGGATSKAAPPARSAVKPGAATGKGKAAAPAKGKGKKNEPSYDDIKEQLTTLVKDVGKDKAIAALARYGAKTLSDVSEEDYAEFSDFLAQCISGEVDPEDSSGTPGEDDLLG
jgi:hypothetical protein